MKNNPKGSRPPAHKTALRQEKLNLLLEIARAYYEEQHDQESIAQSLGISRSQVSRYLAQAWEQNLIQVRVVAPGDHMQSIEAHLKQRFRCLQDVVVVPSLSQNADASRKTIGRACAQYLEKVVRPGLRVCVGSGRTLCEVFHWLHPQKNSNVTIVQAMGNVGHEAMDIDFNEMARAAAKAFNAKVYYLNAPAILGSGKMKELESANPSISTALQLARTADMYIVGVGSIQSGLIFTRGGILQAEDLENLRIAGSVGDICGRFFDIQGREVPSPFSERIVGIELKDLRSSALSIGVAGGADKVPPLIGAMNGEFIKVLITDEQTAVSILAQA